MAFLKYANAVVAQPVVSMDAWDELRIKALALGSAFESKTASAIVLEKYDPAQYLLSHATIIASVDTEDGPGALGRQFEAGTQIDRRFQDYYITPTTSKYVNNNCFVPGTAITMADGTIRPIEAVEEGDSVRTHLGRVRKVTRVFKRQVSETLLEVKPRGTTERLYVTGEHPFFVFRPVSQCVHCDRPIQRKVRAISHLLGRHYCSKECYYAHRVPNSEYLKEKQGEFVESRNLTVNDFSATPVLTETRPTGITLGQARLIGLFAAEGYYELDSDRDNEQVGVCWAFHVNEKSTLAQSVLDLLRSEFGVAGTVREHSKDNGIHVTTCVNRSLVEFFKKWVHGEGSTTKFLDGALLEAERHIQLEIVRGWLEGDGCYHTTNHDSRLSGTSACRSLTNQMQMILHRLGVSSHLTHSIQEGRRRLVVEGRQKVVSDPSKECHSWTLSCGSGWLAELVEGTSYESIHDSSVQAVPELRFLNGYHLQIIENIGEISYEGPVYNFDVEEDHSYIANGVAVHNCDSWERKLLLATFRTFIGGQNFVEHLQVPELSKGRIIDAVARDIGESIYVDILIATERKHKPLIAAITSKKLNTLSMGCFVPGTQVTMKDGSRLPIEEVAPGDLVLTHKGRFREVLNKQIRIGRWGMREIEAVGVPSVITATNNHPFFVLRAPQTCACGCGEALKVNDLAATRRVGKRFKSGHQLRVWNPNKVYSLAEEKERRQRLAATHELNVIEVRADELQVGDFVCFPRFAGENQDASSATAGKARLLGYFLAEGSFLKAGGVPKEVQFNFSLEERDTFAQEVVQLLSQEFPEANPAWIQERLDRNTCTVHVTGGGAPAWFLRYGGEYSHLKRMSEEVLSWPIEAQKHLLGAWLNGDGTRGKANKTLSGTSTSYPLICQMHLVMARCGIFARMECLYEGHQSYVEDAVNGGISKRGTNGKLASFSLCIPSESGGQLAEVCAKVGPVLKKQLLRVFDNYTVFPVTSVREVSYEGPVYDMEIEEDHSYIVEGIAVHNCSVLHTTCSKCGNVAEDETQLCPHIKYAKGNTFIDALGKQRKIAELCGHSTDPKSVKFIEASWVGNPAFKGAVVRSILSPEEQKMLGPQLQKVISLPAPVADPNQMSRAARQVRKLGIPQFHNVLSADFSEDDSEFEGAPDNSPPKKEGDPLDKAVSDIADILKEKALEKVRGEITKEEISPRADLDEDQNNTLLRQASLDPNWKAIGRMLLAKTQDVDLSRKLLLGLILFKKGGWNAVRAANSFSGRELLGISRVLDEIHSIRTTTRYAGETRLYQTVLAAGGVAVYGDVDGFLAACRRILGHDLTRSERDTLITKGRLYDLGVS